MYQYTFHTYARMYGTEDNDTDTPVLYSFHSLFTVNYCTDSAFVPHCTLFFYFFSSVIYSWAMSQMEQFVKLKRKFNV